MKTVKNLGDVSFAIFNKADNHGVINLVSHEGQFLQSDVELVI